MLLLIVNAILYPFSRMVYYQIRNMINKRSKETVRKSNIIKHLILKVLLAIDYLFFYSYCTIWFRFSNNSCFKNGKERKKANQKSEKRILR